jgi:hypothetical protein
MARPSIVRQVRGIRKDKESRVAKFAVRPQDMPACVDCHRQIDPMVAGYDGKWRCLKHNDAHTSAVLRESGDASPNESENRPGVAVKHDEIADAKRKKRASEMLEKYGIERKLA